MCCNSKTPTARIAPLVLAVVLLMTALPAFSKSYLIVKFMNEHKGSSPKWISMYDPSIVAPHSVKSKHGRPLLHYPIDANPMLLEIKHGRYRIDNFGFRKIPEVQLYRRTFYLPKHYTQTFERDRVYYMGDVTFLKTGLSTKPSSDTLEALCKESEIVRSADAIYLIFHSPEPIKIEAPCKQDDQLSLKQQ